jgi:tetratricopeptide (TPR) repeat protein
MRSDLSAFPKEEKMSNYEFWDELGKIFNAVVAYQEKSVEFNKRFINPWIRLGNVFDKQDRNREAVEAYQKAIEIDPANAQNWCDLGSAYFRTEAYDQAIHAFLKAIELDPQLGWPYSNLALAYVTQDNHEQAEALYQKSLELLQDRKDKAVSWNRLGNLYRKLNQYELAVQAFQHADELDRENAGFRDALDETPAALNTGEQEAQVLEQLESPLQLIVEESQAEDAIRATEEAQAALPVEPEAEPLVEAPVLVEATEELPEAATLDVVQTAEQLGRLSDELVEAMATEAREPTTAETEVVTEAAVEAATAPVEAEDSELLAEAELETTEAVTEVEEAPETLEQAPVSVQDVVETFTESIMTMNTTTETTDLSLVQPVEQAEAATPIEEAVPVSVEVEASVEAVEAPATVEESAPALASEVITPEAEVSEEPTALEAPVEAVAEATPEAAPVEEAPEAVTAEAAVVEASEPVIEAVVEAAPVVAAEETPAEAVVEIAEETVTEVAAAEPAAQETVAEPLAEVVEEAIATEAAAEPVAEPVVEPAVVEAVTEAPAELVAEAVVEPAVEEAVTEAPAEAVAEVVVEEAAPEAVIEPAAENAVEAQPEPAGQDPEVPQEAAYEEFLKDDSEILNGLAAPTAEESTPAEPLTKLDASGELQIEMDTKNAHVWNELGNVYFNNGAVDDSIIAYSKAIELDRYFPWPYSNLALAYVQRSRFPEAVLLYQRSIELFSDEKDKAKSWNRLGNVYRRLNDYEHAIEAYQRADELDPDNATLSLQSRFSLLGSYQLEQNASLAA